MLLSSWPGSAPPLAPCTCMCAEAGDSAHAAVAVKSQYTPPHTSTDLARSRARTLSLSLARSRSLARSLVLSLSLARAHSLWHRATYSQTPFERISKEGYAFAGLLEYEVIFFLLLSSHSRCCAGVCMLSCAIHRPPSRCKLTL